RPPSWRSTSATTTSPKPPLHHFLISSGSVRTRNTARRGAANSRVIRTCVSDGVVTTAVPLLPSSAIVVLQLLERLVHACEALFPCPGEAAHPLMDRLQRPALEPVEPLAALLAHAHQADLAQHPQVLRDQRLRQAERPDEVTDGPLPRGEDLEDLPP